VKVFCAIVILERGIENLELLLCEPISLHFLPVA